MNPHRATAREIIKCTCDVLGVTVSEAFGTGRHKRVVLTRMIAWDQLRRRLRMSFQEIAKATGRIGAYGQPAHTTVIDGRNRLLELAECRVSDVLGPHDCRGQAWSGLSVIELTEWVDLAIEALEARVDGDTKRRAC